ncbi:Transcriptional regulator, MarR family [Alkalibacterium sp. AK22]|uniref:MarR family winged helix-turn-helix transcriptional regulator n=1 Tax=Alkalibacterium sp. AK22 TaxID=1229520 RepID=UPI0004525D4B|nr:MarR family transcriptional regulator [Alkalibacterium sp. AK22]EXJ23539.1 Transcriptional regulator, MarR family [Alkalibacterium sp. AK22]
MEYLMRYINRTSRLSELYRGERMQAFDLSGIHHTYIINICSNPGISQENLARLIFVNKSTVARQLAVLEKKGYVDRRQCQGDARKLLVYPTEKAKSVYPAIVDILKDWNSIILDGLSEAEQKEMGRMLRHAMEKARKAALGS